jgi:hypothetical protein
MRTLGFVRTLSAALFLTGCGSQPEKQEGGKDKARPSRQDGGKKEANAIPFGSILA